MAAYTAVAAPYTPLDSVSPFQQVRPMVNVLVNALDYR